MKRAYSSDFKRRVAVAVKTGASAQIVAARLKISVAEVQKWARQHEVDPKKLTRSQREENEIVSALLQHSTNKRYPSDFRGRVAVVVRSGVSARAVASRLGLSVETVQKWAEEYASERKKLPSAQAEKELASLQVEMASMERQIQQRLVEALLDPAGSTNSPSSSCDIELISPIENAEFAMDMGTATAGPTMPQVTLVANNNPCPGENHIQYKFIVGSNGKALTYEDRPAGKGYDDPTPIDSGWLPEGQNTWPINWGGGFYGGHITQISILIQRTDGTLLCSKDIPRDIWIIGGPIYQANNVPTLFDYLNTIPNLGTNNIIMAKAIARDETDTTQYWGGSGRQLAFHKRYPQRERLEQGGYGGGYGVMQLTSVDLLNIGSIWNWKTNVTTGLTRIATAIRNATNRLSQHPDPPVTDLQIRMEAYANYNGGTFYVWNGTQWVEDPSWVCGDPCSPRKGRKVVNGQPTLPCTAIGQCYAEYAHTLEY